MYKRQTIDYHQPIESQWTRAEKAPLAAVLRAEWNNTLKVATRATNNDSYKSCELNKLTIIIRTLGFGIGCLALVTQANVPSEPHSVLFQSGAQSRSLNGLDSVELPRVCVE